MTLLLTLALCAVALAVRNHSFRHVAGAELTELQAEQFRHARRAEVMARYWYATPEEREHAVLAREAQYRRNLAVYRQSQYFSRILGQR